MVPATKGSMDAKILSCSQTSTHILNYVDGSFFFNVLADHWAALSGTMISMAALSGSQCCCVII